MLTKYCEEGFENLCGLNRQIYVDYFEFILALTRRFDSDKETFNWVILASEK